MRFAALEQRPTVMDYWVAKVEVGKVFDVTIPVGKALHLSTACLGEAHKGNSLVHLYVHSDENSTEKNVLGSLHHKNSRNLNFNLSFSKSFKLSHNSKDGAIYFHGGYIADNRTYSSNSKKNAGEGFITKDDISKKRASVSTSETTGHVKKPKVDTPKKDDGMNSSVHVAAPYPSKQDGKTPAKGSHSCKHCNRTFNSRIAVVLHTKAKHA